MSYGFCDISIPRDHRMGKLERPSILRLEFQEDPDKHIVVRHVKALEISSFFRMVEERVSKSREKSVFVFVHGYNVDFDEAARRTAQISYDLGFRGAPIFYSWPSQGALHAYTVDETNVEWTQPNMDQFLEDVAERSGAKRIHLIAHSMGNRALTKALISFASRRRHRGVATIKSVILAAPDIDADVFRRDIAPSLASLGAQVTMYASSADKAIIASRGFHGYPRVGDAGAGLVVSRGLETIDASSVETDFLSHSYFADNTSLIADIFYIIRRGLSADRRRGLERVSAGQLLYWAFRGPAV